MMKQWCHHVLWVRTCFLWLLGSLNRLPHSVHSHGFSPVCKYKWVLRWLLCENFLPHALHSYGFSPVCMRMWLRKWSASPNFLSHWAHGKGRVPECTSCLWRFRLPDWLKSCPHSSHWYGLSSMWRTAWRRRLPRAVNIWPQTRHSNEGRSTDTVSLTFSGGSAVVDVVVGVVSLLAVDSVIVGVGSVGAAFIGFIFVQASSAYNTAKFSSKMSTSLPFALAIPNSMH